MKCGARKRGARVDCSLARRCKRQGPHRLSGKMQLCKTREAIAIIKFQALNMKRLMPLVFHVPLPRLAFCGPLLQRAIEVNAEWPSCPRLRPPRRWLGVAKVENSLPVDDETAVSSLRKSSC